MIIDTIFNFINFIVFIALCTYIFRRFISPLIEENIKAENTEQNALIEERMALEQLQKETEQKSIDNKSFYSYMLKKIGRWRVVNSEKQAFREAQFYEQKLRVQNQAEKKINNIAVSRTYQKAMTPALKKAQVELETYFSSEQSQRAYIVSILRNLKRASE